MKNRNSKQDLCDIVVNAFENLRNMPGVPSVPFNDIPSYAEDAEEDENNMNLDQRQTQREMDKQIVPDNEFYD